MYDHCTTMQLPSSLKVTHCNDVHDCSLYETIANGISQPPALSLPALLCQEGVKFRSPHDDTEMLLTPEHSVEIQNTIGADIIMQLDDVVHSMTTGPRVEEAMWRTVRWLDRWGAPLSYIWV